MKIKKIFSLLLFFLITLIPFSTWAEVEWEIQNTLKLDSAPIDTAVSANGKWIFILTKKGKINIYSAKGTLEDTIEAGKHVNKISLGYNENILYLQSKKKKKVEIINIEYIQNINVAGSPFKGPKDAPVAIVVFSDFQ